MNRIIIASARYCGTFAEQIAVNVSYFSVRGSAAEKSDYNERIIIASAKYCGTFAEQIAVNVSYFSVRGIAAEKSDLKQRIIIAPAIIIAYLRGLSK